MHHVEIISGAVCVLFCFVFAGSGGEFGGKEGSFLKVSECFYYSQWEFANRTLEICLVLES